jgi:hypothetical protein
MLRSFRLTNHKSIRDEQELVLIPAYDKNTSVVPVAAVFGANASGKSTLLDGLLWMRTAVLDSFAVWQPGSGVPRRPFRLAADAARLSSYVVELELAGVKYSYGFEVDDERVRQEWLYAYPHSRRRVVFEREDSSIRLGSTLPDARSREETLAGLTRENTLLLSVAAHSNQIETLPVYQWLRSGIRVVSDENASLITGLVDRINAGGARRQSTLALIRAADLGIRDVQAVHGADERTLAAMRVKFEHAAETRARAHEIIGKLRNQLAESSEQSARATRELLEMVQGRLLPGAVADEERALMDLNRAQAAREEPPRLMFVHQGGSAPLELEDESAGTRTWLALLSAALDALEQGGLLVVDELDRSLHPHLSARLVNLFRESGTNPRGAQLLFTTHDTTLLGEDTLSRDEIWFVEKEPDTGVTKLFALTDFHPRKNENTERRYLAGSYGAVPVISETELRDALSEHHRADDAA